MTKAEKLKRVGAITIERMMRIMEEGSALYTCEFCDEYEDWGRDDPCGGCPIDRAAVDNSVHICNTATSGTLANSVYGCNNPDNLRIPILQALILWIHDLTGAPIPEKL